MTRCLATTTLPREQVSFNVPMSQEFAMSFALLVSSYRFMPNLGEHSKEVLLEYGFSDEEINNLAIQNIISVR